MSIRSWLSHSVQIARIERRRSRRQLGRSSTWRAVIAIVLVSIAVGTGIRAYTVGTALRRGQAMLPFETMRIAVTAGFLVLLIGLVQRTSGLLERLDTDHLLTTVSAREVVLGVILTVATRTVTRIFPLTIGVAIGFAVGTRSLASALTIIVAVAGFLSVTALIGVGLGFVMELVSTRSPRFRRYKTLLVVLALGLVMIVWTVMDRGLISSAIGLMTGWLVVPPAWFVDLGLLGVPGIQSNVLQSVGALGWVVSGIPILTVVITALATRVWETEPVSAATIHRSRPLVVKGVAERLFSGHVSRPVLTVARKRWLQERRIPVGLMMTGYLTVLLPGVFLPAFAAGTIPGLSLIAFVFICASGTGIAFGMPLLALEYSSLPMTLTTVPGRQYIRGTVLAGVALGGPITVLGTLVLGIWSPLGVLELLLLAIGGVVLCVCSVTFGTALSLRLSYYEFRPVPFPFTNTTVYGVVGRREFINLGMVLALVGLVCLPAFVSYGVVFVNAQAATALAASTAGVRIGSLVLMVALAGGVSAVAYRRAVARFNEYSLP